MRVAHFDESVEIQFLLNGKLVSAAFDLSHTQGKIQVQSELAEIFVRRIELQPLREADWKLAASVSG